MKTSEILSGFRDISKIVYIPQKTPKSPKCRHFMNTRFDLINGKNSVFCAASTVMISIFEKSS